MDNQDELFVVVDKNDRIIEYRSRYDCHHDKTLIHRAVGTIVFNKKGEILLQKRSKHKDLNPGMYDISSSGHVSPKETYLAAAKRELSEELGIRAFLKKRKKFLVHTEDETEMDCLFTTTYEGPLNVSKEEIDEALFVPPGELKKMKAQLTPFAKNSLKQVSLL